MASVPTPSPGGRRRTIGTIACALLLTAMLASNSAASIGSQLHDAKARLAHLAQQIRRLEAQVVQQQDRLASLDAQIADATGKAHALGVELSTTRQGIAGDRRRRDALQAQLDQIARNAFMGSAGGPVGDFLAAITQASSMRDVADRIAFLSSIDRWEADLATHVATAQARLAFKAAQIGTLLARQNALLATLAKDRQEQASAVQQSHATLAKLDRTRNTIVTLVARLKKQLRVEELAALSEAFQGTNNAPYGQWAGLFLTTIRAPSCQSDLVAMVAWQLSEFTQAAWNPLATTWPMPGSTTFNGAGVQNYGSIDQGLQATLATLDNGLTRFGYGAIVSALQRCADPMTIAEAINASAWCGGCAGGAYVTDNIARVGANYGLYAAL